MVYQHPRTQRWFFHSTIRKTDGCSERVHGTPGVPGPYHDLPQSKHGACEAERRAIRRTTNALTIDATALKKAAGDFATAELARGRSHKTVNNMLHAVSRVIAYVTGEPTEMRLPPHEIHAARAVDPAAIERLLDACDDDRYRAAILLATEAGLRAGEILDLQWGDIRDANLAVRVSMQYGPRIVPLSSRLADALDALPRLGQWVVARLDGSKIDEHTLMHALGAICDRATVARPLGGLLRCLRLAFRNSELAKKGK